MLRRVEFLESENVESRTWNQANWRKLELIRGIENLEPSELELIRGNGNSASREFVEARTWN